MPSETELIVTNMHRNYTGVSSTTKAIVQKQAERYKMEMAGGSLLGCPDPISYRRALRLSRTPPPGRSHLIWHVRRNNEMRAALWARDVLKLPIRIAFTSSAQRRHSAFPRWLISRMDAVIATSEKAASFIPNVTSIVPHGVDTERFHPPADRAEAWKKTGHPGSLGIANVGRIRPDKGSDIFVESMIRLLPDIPEATALIVGKATPPYRRFKAELQRRIDAAGLSDRIIFTGEIGPAKLPELVASLSLMVTPPRYEGFGMTPLEAMSSGVPIVASDEGFYAKMVGKNKAGILIKKAEPGEIASAAREMLENPMELALKAGNARSRALEQFGIDREVNGIHEVYEMLWDRG